jgi:hypothetical protein
MTCYLFLKCRIRIPGISFFLNDFVQVTQFTSKKVYFKPIYVIAIKFISQQLHQKEIGPINIS